ncbi:hypothetical protein GE09DRAFT_1250714 [Coniochaeta sp. 2T2.1]|nr:hypothetical protein GE09DRAFT_1250714 [Coniochaeta sp. 2T2.1]
MSSPSRTVIGPLTTIFTPPQQCSTAYFNETVFGWLEGLYGFYADCQSTRQCYPGTGTELKTYDLSAFYSPGLYCPKGWNSAPYGGWNDDTFDPSPTLLPGESATFCCPSRFDYGFRNLSRNLQGGFSYVGLGVDESTAQFLLGLGAYCDSDGDGAVFRTTDDI